MPRNWEQRERKQQRRKNGMRVSGRSAFVIKQAAKERDRKFIERAKQRKDK